MVEELFYLSVVQSLAAAFLLLLAYKWRAVEWLQVHGNGFFSKMAHCGFCLSWWANAVVALVFAVAVGDFLPLPAAVCATPITRVLI